MSIFTVKPNMGRVFRICFPLLLAFWILIVLYPNPTKLFVSVHRIFDPGIDPVSVEAISSRLPDDPAAIDSAVKQLVPYSYDWKTYGMPWYVPTVQEVLEKGEGDCKGRALVLASTLESKNISYYINLSPTHMWVEYEQKQATHVENPEVKFYQENPQTGQRTFQVPSVPVSEIADTFWGGFWDPMPWNRRALLIVGLPALVKLRVVWRGKRKKRQSYPRPSSISRSV